MKKTEIDPALGSGNGIDKEIGIEQEQANQAVGKIGKGFKLSIINTDENQDNGISEEKKIQLLIKYGRRRRATVPGRTEEAGQRHGGNEQEDDHHNPVEIMNKTSVESQHDHTLLLLLTPDGWVFLLMYGVGRAYR